MIGSGKMEQPTVTILKNEESEEQKSVMYVANETEDEMVLVKRNADGEPLPKQGRIDGDGDEVLVDQGQRVRGSTGRRRPVCPQASAAQVGTQGRVHGKKKAPAKGKGTKRKLIL